MTSGRAALVLGIVHAVVDCACAFVLFRDVSTPERSLVAVIAWIVSYDALAFLLQAPIGLLADRLRADRELGLVGLALVLVALATGPFVPGGGALVAALGNALYHVGAGASVLRTSGVRAAEIGLFVGPGATGLVLGIVLGRGDAPARVAIGLALLVGAYAAMRSVAAVERNKPGGASPSRIQAGAILLGCALLLLTVATRSIVGDTVTSIWRGQPAAILLALALASSAGKMLGGLVGDRIGWRRSAGVSLALAGPLLALGLSDRHAAAAGLLLLQATTPLTLKAFHRVIPDRPGFAFGLPSAVLVLGAAPGIFSLWILRAGPLVLAAAWLSAAAVVAGLRLVAAAERGKMDDTR
jgi:MFS transporter, FSR family, fosmidomycin resistance protein